MAFTTILGTDQPANSRTDINNNFAKSTEGAASSTNNAIARFDGTTGKLLQNSGLTLSDLTVAGGGRYYFTISAPDMSGIADSIQIKAPNSTDNDGGRTLITGGNALSGDFAGGDIGGTAGTGHGTGSGGSFIGVGGPGGATGAGGSAIVQGGAGGATSGDGGTTAIRGGSATNGNSNGGSVAIAPGAKNGSGDNGTISLYDNVNATYYANLDISQIASSVKQFTFPNATGSFAIVTSGTADPTAGAAPAAIGLIYCKTDTGKVYISTGTSAGSDWKILN